MANLLVDSHAIVWWLLDSDRLSRRAYRLIEDPANRLIASAASVWEIAIKIGVGKLKSPEDLPQRLEREGFVSLPVSAEHGWAVRNLPHHHRDPFDRLLVAQARVEKLAIVSGDRRLDAYGIDRLW